MKPMEHMEWHWEARYEDQMWSVVAHNGTHECFVFQACAYLPGDETGELSARAICDAHNKQLKEQAK